MNHPHPHQHMDLTIYAQSGDFVTVYYNSTLDPDNRAGPLYFISMGMTAIGAVSGVVDQIFDNTMYLINLEGDNVPRSDWGARIQIDTDEVVRIV